MPKDQTPDEKNKTASNDTAGNPSDAKETSVEHLLDTHGEPEVQAVSAEELLRKDYADVKDRLLRLAAEFENYKRITQREQQNSLKFANEGLITNLLPIVDNLEQAVAACNKSVGAPNDVLVGVEMVIKQFVEVLKRYGVEIYSALGLPFDPARHEAMGEQVDEHAEDGTVIVEYQKGYLLHGRLLRAARVIVARRQGK